MAKNKKPKRINSDSVHTKKTTKQAAPKKLNPFEVHVNKEKFQILGRTCKHDRGLPGVSRAKAVQKRKETLGREFLVKNKLNQFTDRRIGGGSLTVTDDLANARFAAEKMAQFKTNKQDRFNLNDDEILTHRGQTLEEIEQFHNDGSDEDDEDQELDANFTEVAHFGGDDNQVDRKAAIDEMIVEAKRKKMELAKDKDEVYELTNNLDQNYKELVSLIGKFTKNDDIERPKPDDYDRAMREMIFEPRGAVTDKLESEEEIARKERQRLEKLEHERLARMRGEEVGDNKPKHRSADDLDDGYFFAGDDDDVEDNPTLAYDLDGKVRTGEDDEKGAEEEEEEEEETDKDEDDSDDELEAGENEAEEEEASDGESGSEEDEDADNLSDLKESESESEAEIEEKPSKKSKKLQENVKIVEDLKAKASQELPYTFDMPTKYEELTALLSKHPPDYQGVIVERIIKCNHPQLDGSNRDKMAKLFAFLLQYLNDRFADATEADICTSFMIFDRLNPHLFDLVHLNGEKSSNCILDVIKEKYADFKKNPRNFPSVDTVIYFKLVSNLFSTSDFRHNVVTPCFIFISHILSKAKVRTRQDVAVGLFLVTVVLEYTQLSKRFLPAALNFLLGIVYLSIPKRPIEMIKIVPPFPQTGLLSKLLAIGEPAGEGIKEELMKAEDLVTTTINTDFKVRALNTSLKLIKDATEILSDNVGSNFIAAPFLDIMNRLSLDNYPKFIKTNFENAKNSLETVASKPLTKLLPPERKPKALRLFEPKVVKIYDDKRRPKLSEAKEEKAKLLHKIKRETKGAVREIRRDTDFLQKIKIKQQMQSDSERREKVKRIFSEAALQQGELNEMSRAKKKKK